MDSSTVLGSLKWAALALGVVSALWGLLARRSTEEDEHGRKRLTASGVVTVALMVASSLIAAVSFGFETLEKEAAKREEAARGRDLAAAQAIRDQRDWMTNAETRAIRAEQRAAVAEGRAAAANQRATAVALAAEARLRDLALSREVALGTTRNLERTGRALTQIERVLQPLEPLTVTAEIELAPSAPGMASWGARVAAHVRAQDARAKAERAGQYCRVNCEFVPTKIARILPSDALYPKFDRASGEKDIHAHLATLRFHLSFFSSTTSEAELVALARNTQRSPSALGDLRLHVTAREQPPVIDYVVATGAMRIGVRGEVTLDRMDRTGAIVSFPDLERSLALAEVEANPGNPVIRRLFRVVELTIESATRTYRPDMNRIRRMEALPDRAAYVLPQLIPIPR